MLQDHGKSIPGILSICNVGPISVARSARRRSLSALKASATLDSAETHCIVVHGRRWETC